MRKSIVVHPFLLAIYSILFLYANNVDFTLFSDALVPMAIATGFAILFFLSLTFILKDKVKAGLLVSLFLSLFFSYGHFSYAMEGFHLAIGESVVGPDGVLIPIWGLLFVLGAYFLVKTRRDLHTLTNVLNIVAISLVAISLVNIVVYEVKTPAWPDKISAEGGCE